MQTTTLSRVDPALLAEAKVIFSESRSAATLRAYRSDLGSFTAFCDDNGLESFPCSSSTLIFYLTWMGRHYRWSTIKRHVASISVMHRLRGGESPVGVEVKEFLGGLRRRVGEGVDRQRPLLAGDIVRMLSFCDDSLVGIRDRALLLFGFTSWLRRGTIVGLSVDDLTFVDGGMRVFVGREKQDQTGKGRTVFVGCGSGSSCPVAAMRSWLDAAGIVDGRLFRSIDRWGAVGSSLSGEGLRLLVRRYGEKVGLDVTKIGPHSLRAGGATQATVNGMPFDAAMKYGGWSSAEVFRGYIRRGKDISANEYLGV